MAGEGGRAYEQDLYTKLNQAGVVPEGFTPAASDSNAPDIIFYANGGSTYNLEVKLNLLDWLLYSKLLLNSLDPIFISFSITSK